MQSGSEKIWPPRSNLGALKPPKPSLPFSISLLMGLGPKGRQQPLGGSWGLASEVVLGLLFVLRARLMRFTGLHCGPYLLSSGEEKGTERQGGQGFEGRQGPNQESQESLEVSCDCPDSPIHLRAFKRSTNRPVDLFFRFLPGVCSCDQLS